MKKTPPATTVDAYIAQFEEPVHGLLLQLRSLIHKAAPKAEEGISYGMPAYKYMGPLVYFAGYAKHVGLYATPSGNKAFAKELAGYKTSKGTIQFPLDKKLPATLITKLVKFRVKENEATAAVKKNK
jgi:uncharacterized protein YdhG (YjbR/CyaY superfamily)